MGKKTIILINTVAILLLVGALATAGYFYMKYRTLSKGTGAGTAAAAREISDTIKKVGKLIQLPSGESPTFATVTDVEKLKSQAFFKNAKNGDKVLIYQKALKAILYRPSEDKIIDVGPIKLQDKGKVAGTSTETTKKVTPVQEKTGPVTAALYNGSNIAGITASVEAQLKDKFPNVNVVSRAPAGTTGYKFTLIVDITGGHTTLAQTMAKQLGGRISSLPKQEATPSADLLIIVGNAQ